MQQTAQLEHETFALKQQAALTAEIKSVLDGWVRHEAQVREAEQRELVQTVLANVQKQLGDKKLQRDILLAGVAEVEGRSGRGAGSDRALERVLMREAVLAGLVKSKAI